MAHVCCEPAAIARASVRLLTGVGVVGSRVEPIPSGPNALLPQQRAVPLASSAQV